MKHKPIKLVILLILLMVGSCNEPETVVTDFVHPDGSVTRVIEMKSITEKPEDRFKPSDLQVPLDKSWKIKDSTEVNKKGDTLWTRRAEKLFRNVDEINSLYKLDTGKNKESSRHAGFKKSFRWFNTEFRFSEMIDEKLSTGFPVKDFLNAEELLYFYSPENLKYEKENGTDSLKFRSLSDSVSQKTDKWAMKNIVSEWIIEFTKLTDGRGGKEISRESLKAREDELVKIFEIKSDKIDSLLKNGVLLKEIIGETNAMEFRPEADSAFSIVKRNFWDSFKDYSVRIVMPGKLTGTNGFIDSCKMLLWPVKSDYFLTQPYEMWAESKIPNRWAWVVSGLFLIFVLTGVIIRVKKS